jgi:hypothetical protein
MNSHLIIRTCRHVLPHGRHCQGAAVRGRACCRHHLDARTRLHNMARARRLTCIPRFRVPVTPRDLALNRAEALRVVATGGLDFDTARMIFWALDLSATGIRSEYNLRLRQARIRTLNPNRIYQVPVTPQFSECYTENPTEVIENKEPRGEAYTTKLGPRSDKLRSGVGSLQPRRGAISKPSASALGKRRGR